MNGNLLDYGGFGGLSYSEEDDMMELSNTTICNIKKAELNKRGISNFTEWNKKQNTVYIGRNMSFFVEGTYQSKWHNPFSSKKATAKNPEKNNLEEYENYIRNNKELYDSLEELDGKELGCWCKPKQCHGDVLIKLLCEKKYYKK